MQLPAVVKPRILHVWDTRVDSGRQLDDMLEDSGVRQKAIVRVLIRSGQPMPLDQSFQIIANEMNSPVPRNILLRFQSKQRFKKELIREIARFKPDLIFFHFGQTAASHVKLVAKRKIPYLTAFYGHDISIALKQMRWRLSYRRFVRYPGYFLVLARSAGERLNQIGIGWDRIFLFNHPLNLNPYTSVPKIPSGNRFRITIPGRFVEKKGHIYLFEAVKYLKEKHHFIEVTLLGYGDQTKLRAEADLLGISDQLSWIDTALASIRGEFDSVYVGVLAKSDLVVLPCVTTNQGDDEGGPALLLCLAQAAGVPVLTTAFLGHEVTITSGETGLIARERDSQDLAQKILWAMENPGELAMIAEEGKLSAGKVFSTKPNVDKLLHVIQVSSKR